MIKTCTKVTGVRYTMPHFWALCQTMRDRVGASLRGMRERGAVGSDEGKGVGVRWGLL